MNAIRRIAVVALMLGAMSAGFTPGSSLAQPIDVACSPSSPAVSLPETIRVRAWAISPGDPLSFRWAATTGQIGATGAEGDWKLDSVDAKPPYRATVRVDSDAGRFGTCTIEIWLAGGGRGREAGSALLVQGRKAPGGYGLYSYILLGAPPVATTRERYLKTLEAWWTLAPALLDLQRYLSPSQLNVTLVPVRGTPPAKISTDWLLEHYDYARARALLHAAARDGRRAGPYIVSSLAPLGDTPSSGPYLFQDLSAVPPTLASEWVKEFLNQSAQERFWQQRTAAMLGLRLRTTLTVLAEGVGAVQSGLASWITWGAGLPVDQPGR
jgi:hypothetical protein